MKRILYRAEIKPEAGIGILPKILGLLDVLCCSSLGVLRDFRAFRYLCIILNLDA